MRKYTITLSHERQTAPYRITLTAQSISDAMKRMNQLKPDGYTIKTIVGRSFTA